MGDRLTFLLTLAAALGSGVIAGLFFAFSTSVMRALGKMPPGDGMATMQHINVVILNPLFLSVFMGTALVSAAAAVLGVFSWARPGSVWLIAGALLYIVGSLGVTIVLNVPMNNALAAADPASVEGVNVWKDYLANWTFWNHIRAIASFAAAGAFSIGLYLLD